MPKNKFDKDFEKNLLEVVGALRVGEKLTITKTDGSMDSFSRQQAWAAAYGYRIRLTMAKQSGPTFLDLKKKR